MSAARKFSPLRRKEKRQQAPFRIVGIYLLISILWIVLSDRFLLLLVPEPEIITAVQTYKGVFFVVSTALLLFWLIRRSHHAAQAKDNVIRQIFAGVSAVTGEAFFHTLVRKLSEVLECDYALIGMLDPCRQKVSTLAVCCRGNLEENFAYHLEGTPCANVFSGDLCIYPARAAERFPEDRMLAERGIEAYMGVPIRNGKGEPVGILAVMDGKPFMETEWFEDVFQIFAQRAAAELERQGAEEALKAGERALQEQFSQLVTIFDSLNALVYVADMDDNRLLYVNRYGETLFGEDWRNRACYEVLQLGQNEVCPFCTNEQLVRNGEPQPPCIWEFQNTRNRRWYQCTDKAIRWTDGRLVRMEVAVDITEHKEMDRLKDEMISALSHEMRTPLTAILGYIDFLLGNEVRREQLQECLTTALRQAERLNELIGTSLDLQRIRAGSLAAGAASVNLRGLLEEVRLHYSSQAGRHRILVDCPDDLPAVFGSREQIAQVLTQLVSNAIKFSPDGGKVTLAAHGEEGSILLQVTDEGIGIGSEDLGRIFDSFYRVDNSDTRFAGGAGLGLSLVREIVRLHGGEVWAESRLGKGSTFYVRLPAAPMKVSPDFPSG